MSGGGAGRVVPGGFVILAFALPDVAATVAGAASVPAITAGDAGQPGNT